MPRKSRVQDPIDELAPVAELAEPTTAQEPSSTQPDVFDQAIAANEAAAPTTDQAGAQRQWTNQDKGPRGIADQKSQSRNGL